MTSPSTISEPNRLFAIPPEILFRILKETTQKEECWIKILTKGESPCGSKGRCNTLVYTKGTEAPGPKSYPFHHECIFKRPVADGEIGIKDTFVKNWERDLQENRLRNQLNVYERSLDPDLVDNVRSVCRRIANEDIPTDELTRLCKRVPVLYKTLTAVLSIPHPIYGNPDEERNPGEKQPFPSGNVRECQSLKHVMIRSSSWESLHDDLTLRAFREARNPFPRHMPISREQMYFRMIIDMRKIDDDVALLNQDWSLLSGLESLCFDLNTENWCRSVNKVVCLLSNMSRYLKLKTLVVFDFHKDTFEQPTMVAWLMRCLQPGGELHLITAIPMADL